MTVEQVDPRDFILPDGSIDVTPDNWPSLAEMERVRSGLNDGEVEHGR